MLALCCIVLLGSVPARGQSVDNSKLTISTDRPSVTNSSVVVPKGFLQAENGTLFDGNRNFTVETTFLLDRWLTKPWDVFVEYAGDFPERNGTRQILQLGSTYKITPRQQIDFHVAFGLSRTAPDSFIGIGYSFLVRLAKGT